MRINFVCHKLSGTGGTETVLVKVINFLAEKYDVSLILPNNPPNDLWLKKINSEVKVEILEKPSKISKTFYFFKFFFRASDDDRFVILGANTIKFAYYVRKVLNKNYHITSWIHFSLFQQKMFDPQNVVYADDHWAISSVIKKQLEKLGVAKERIHLIFNPIERTSLVKFDEKNTQEIRLVYIGRIMLNGQKNLKELLDAVKKSPERIIVEFFGTGREEQQCHDYASKIGIKDHVIWHGWSSAPWSEIQSRPAALVLSSKFEGLPMVMLEAISRGIPTLTSRFPGYDDVCIEGINGYSYESKDLNDFVQKMELLGETSFDPRSVANSITKFYTDNYFKNLESIVSYGRKDNE